MTEQFELQTLGGYPLDEAVSALQKCIRRGLEKQSMFWALELNGRYSKYLWRRLVAIVVEDIGMANMELVGVILSLRMQVEDLRKISKVGDYTLNALAFAILAMARSPKSRESDVFMNEVLRDIRNKRADISVPDFALDMHTKRGRQMGRGADHFWEHGAHVENEAYPSAYTGYDPDEGDGWKNPDGKKHAALDGTQPKDELSREDEQSGLF